MLAEKGQGHPLDKRMRFGIRVEHDSFADYISLYSYICLELRIGHEFHSLPHAEICQYFFGSAKNRVKLIRPVKHLHHSSHSSLCQASSAEDVRGIVGNFVCASRTKSLQESDRSTQMLRLEVVGQN